MSSSFRSMRRNFKKEGLSPSFRDAIIIGDDNQKKVDEIKKGMLSPEFKEFVDKYDKKDIALRAKAILLLGLHHREAHARLMCELYSEYQKQKNI